MYVERLRRDRHFEKLLARRIEGDIVDLELGLKTKSPFRFGDVGTVIGIVCRHGDKPCLDDPVRGRKLGSISVTRSQN